MPEKQAAAACRNNAGFFPAVLGADAAVVTVRARSSIVSAIPVTSTPYIIAGTPAILMCEIASKPSPSSSRNHRGLEGSITGVVSCRKDEALPGCCCGC